MNIDYLIDHELTNICFPRHLPPVKHSTAEGRWVCMKPLPSPSQGRCLPNKGGQQSLRPRRSQKEGGWLSSGCLSCKSHPKGGRRALQPRPHKGSMHLPAATAEPGSAWKSGGQELTTVSAELSHPPAHTPSCTEASVPGAPLKSPVF